MGSGTWNSGYSGTHPDVRTDFSAAGLTYIFTRRGKKDLRKLFLKGRHLLCLSVEVFHLSSALKWPGRGTKISFYSCSQWQAETQFAFHKPQSLFFQTHKHGCTYTQYHDFKKIQTHIINKIYLFWYQYTSTLSIEYKNTFVTKKICLIFLGQ